MRALPWLFVLLLLGVGGYLGLQVLERRGDPVPVPAPAATTASTVPQGHVYSGLTDEPDTLNPFTTVESSVRRYVLAFTHEGLIDTDPDTLELRPVLAQSWHMQPGGTEITIVLRPGVCFADGKPCTPSDVMYTWEVCKAQPAMLGSMADGMSLLRDVQLLPGEPATLQLQLKQPHFAALRAIGESWIVVQRAWFEQQIADLAARRGQPVPQPGDAAFAGMLAEIKYSGPGTGPYMLAPDRDGVSRWPGDSRDVQLVRNPRSWRKAMYPDRWNFAGLHLYVPADRAQPWLQFRKRQLDWFPDVDLAEAAPDLVGDFHRVVYDNKLYGPVVVNWNLRRLPDPRVRRALGMLFDREVIARDYCRGAGVPAASYFWPDSGSCPPDLQPLPFDPPAARRLLRKAGYDAEAGHPLQLQVIIPLGRGVELLGQIGRSFVKAAQDCGIAIDVHELALPAIAGLQQQGEWDGYLLRRDFRSYVDPYETFHSGGGSNVTGLADAEIDDLLARARCELDDAARQRLFQSFCRRLDELQPMSFLVFQRTALLINSHLQEAVPGRLGLAAEKMWVPVEFQRR